MDLFQRGLLQFTFRQHLLLDQVLHVLGLINERLLFQDLLQLKIGKRVAQDEQIALFRRFPKAVFIFLSLLCIKEVGDILRGNTEASADLRRFLFLLFSPFTEDLRVARGHPRPSALIREDQHVHIAVF